MICGVLLEEIVVTECPTRTDVLDGARAGPVLIKGVNAASDCDVYPPYPQNILSCSPFC